MTELLHLLGNPAHWAFELVSDAALGLVFTPLWAWLMARHDRRKH